MADSGHQGLRLVQTLMLNQYNYNSFDGDLRRVSSFESNSEEELEEAPAAVVLPNNGKVEAKTEKAKAPVEKAKTDKPENDAVKKGKDSKPEEGSEDSDNSDDSEEADSEDEVG